MPTLEQIYAAAYVINKFKKSKMFFDESDEEIMEKVIIVHDHVIKTFAIIAKTTYKFNAVRISRKIL